MSLSERKESIRRGGGRRLSIVRRCRLLSVPRSSLYYRPKGESERNLNLMRLIDEQHLETPYYGSRQMMRHLKRRGFRVGRERVRRLMRLMGLSAVYCKPKTSKAHPEHRIYPYLLRGLKIDRVDQVWCSDITYIPMRRGFFYLTAIMDWYSRRVPAWRLSNTLHVDFCVDALSQALARYDKPEILNTDQGSQFTSPSFTTLLQQAGVRISMDGKGRWMDNIFIERLWRSLKYECVYLQEFSTGSQARTKIGQWFDRHNTRRPHSSHGILTPSEVYDGPRADFGSNLALGLGPFRIPTQRRQLKHRSPP